MASKRASSRGKTVPTPVPSTPTPTPTPTVDPNDDPNVQNITYTKDDVRTFTATYIISNFDNPNHHDPDDSDDDVFPNPISLKGLPNLPGNHCFLNCALQTIVWLAQLGPLKFIIDDWDTIKNHRWLNCGLGDDSENESDTIRRRSSRIINPFVALFEIILINIEGSIRAKKEDVTKGLYYLQQITANTFCKLPDTKSSNGQYDARIAKLPSAQQFGDPTLVFYWLYDCFLVMSGVYSSYKY
jgi:hypothetical protein